MGFAYMVCLLYYYNKRENTVQQKQQDFIDTMKAVKKIQGKIEYVQPYSFCCNKNYIYSKVLQG